MATLSVLVIPGRRAAPGPESMLPVARMDSGFAARSQVHAGCVNLPATRRPGMTEFI